MKLSIQKYILFALAALLTTTSFAQNAITTQNMNLHATFHNIGIQVDYTGDVNKNATAALEINVNGAGFKTVHRLSRVGTNRFVGTAFSVAPATNVGIRVTFSDPDGVNNPVLTGNITTRSEQVPVSAGAVIHVATTGNDGTGNGTATNPYQTIQHAVDLAVPGNKIVIHAGTYHEFTEISYKNTTTANTPITLTNAGDGTVILDGTDETFNNPAAWTSEGNNLYSITLNDTYYIGVDGNRLWRYTSLADLQNLIYNTNGGFYSDALANKTYLKLPNNEAPTGHQITVSTLKRAFDIFESQHIIIDGLTFRNFNGSNEGAHSSSIQAADSTIQLWVVNCIFENMQTPIRLEGYVEDIVVMGNEFSDQGVNVLDWDFVKEFQWWLERGALYITNDGYTGKGAIFYQNNVHDMFDGVKIVGSEDDFTAYATNSDVESNTFFHLSDDGVEVDGFSCNIRIFNNRFENLLAGVSVAPAQAGPVYIIRNLMIDLNNVASPDWETTAVKFNYDGERSGEVFVYHNTASTFESEQAALSITNSSNWDNLTFKNNIWQGTLYAFYHWLDNTNTLTMTQNQDLLYSTSPTLTLFDGTEYFDLPSYFNNTGLCQNCGEGDPLFENIGAGNYNLTAASPALDLGVLILGINDVFFGNGPDKGAIESNFTLFPVTWAIPLYAQKETHKIKLQWATALEQNTAFFVIERGKDAISWEEIGQHTAKGSHSTYTFYDREPLAGHNFYRLRQVDFDGTFEYANIVAIDWETLSTKVNIFPNPFTDLARIEIKGKGKYQFLLYNSVGKQVRKIDILQNGRFDLYRMNLPAGVYGFEVISNGVKIETGKLMIGE